MNGWGAADEWNRAYAIIPPMFPPPPAIAPQLSGKTQAARNFLIVHGGLIACALFALVGIATAGDYGIAFDESIQRRIAQANLNYILGRADRVVTDIYHDRVYGVVFELPLLLAERGLGLADYHSIHRLRSTLSHLFFILGGYFCYRLAYQLSGHRLTAMLALLFYLLHPRIYGQSYVNSKDPVFLSMFVIALYLLERAFRKDTIAAFLLLGIAVGLLTNLRIMGAMLFAAALALRGMDWFYAGTWLERKHILRTAGLFAVAAGLTLYAVTPYAWTNPGEYLTVSLEQTINRATFVPQLFQGRLFLSNEPPPQYTAVWFGISTPPLFLLLGLAGIAVAGFLRRPGLIFRNNRRRLLLLLLACLLLPPLAAALLGSTQYQDWRHLYFLYAPFCLLAAMGGGWLLAALARQRYWRVGAYGLAGLGLGLVMLQMVQIHPLQYIYFNFLVDRATPEYLRTQYEMDHLELAYREGLEYLPESQPGAALVVRARQRHLAILPPAARERLEPATAGRNADYELLHRLEGSQPDLDFNSGYRRRLYNNTLLTLRPLDSSRMTAAAVAAYREIYRDAVAGEPILRADYNVYLDGNRLIFVRENCPPGGRDEWFGVKPFPPLPETLPPYSPQARFYAPYYNHRVRLGALCLAVIQLPADIRGDLILTRRPLGNAWPAAAPLWEELYTLSGPGWGEVIAEHRRKHPPLILNSVEGRAAAFDVFTHRDAAGRQRLLYAKTGCTPEEFATRVTLHIAPADLADLPANRRGHTFENRNFYLDYYGGRPGGECLAAVPLPDYPIAAIQTGQTDRWEVNLYPPDDPEPLRAAYAALADRQTNSRGIFDLYWGEGRLVYLRETCAAADTAANFFLHIIPADGSDLPAERRAAGFANWDFAFERWGGHFDGKCLAAVPLPDYPIAAIRTGQYVAGQGELWAAELTAAR